jgi:glucose-1-phosphate adenylyltransferase
MRQSVLGMVLAGGEGTRLSPLTRERAKPAVPFGGKYRIIDFVLSNFVNSGIDSIYVLTQFRSQSLSEHINEAWNVSSPLRRQFIHPVPAQMQNSNKRWYDGTADAIWQNLNLVKEYKPDTLAVFGGDHIYKMDISQMIKYHEDKDALATIAAIPVPLSEGSEFGIIEVDDNGLITGFQEKPEHPTPMPNNPGMCLASMGNYLFNTEWICKVLDDDSDNDSSSHDFGHDILLDAVETKKIYAYDFQTNSIPGQEDKDKPYWKDVGTLQAFYEANMDLRRVVPNLDLYCDKWPIHTNNLSLPPAKFVHNKRLGDPECIGKAIDSIICNGCIISGSTVLRSILSPKVRVHSYSSVSDSIIMDAVDIQQNCHIKNAIIDKGVTIQAGTSIGYDREFDEKHFKVVDLYDGKWLTVISKNQNVYYEVPTID